MTREFKTYQDIKTLQDACEHQGLDYEKVMQELNGLSVFPENLRSTLVADAELLIVATSINQLDNNYKPDWNNWDEYKYYPWFRIDANKDNTSGFGFSHSYFDYARTCTDLGSRLCFRSSTVALYVGETFADIYKRKILIQG